MKNSERKIIKEQREDGRIVYRYSDFNEEINENMINAGHLSFRFSLMIEKFKAYLNLSGDDEESVSRGIVLSPIIRDVERELEAIAELINNSLGAIQILYKEDCRYNNFYDRVVVGFVFNPANKKVKAVAA